MEKSNQNIKTHQSTQKYDEINTKFIKDQFDRLFYIYNVKSNEITWNGGFKEVLGYDDSEMNSFNISDWENSISPEDKSKTLELHKISIINKTPYETSYSFKNKNGKYLQLEDYGNYHEENGNIYLMGSMKDVSEITFIDKIINIHSVISEKITISKSLEETLVFVTKSIDEIFENEIKSTVNLIENNKIKKLCSYNLNENIKTTLIGLDLKDGNGITNYVFNKKTSIYISDIKESIYFQNFPKLYLDSNFSSAIGYPVLDNNNNCLATLNIFKSTIGDFDKLLHKYVEKFIGLIKIAIEKNNNDKELKKLASVVQKASYMILIFDDENKITWANEFFYKFTELSPEDILNTNILNFPNSEMYNPLQYEYFQKSIINKTSYNIEIYNLTKSGRPYWVEISGTPNYDEDHKFRGYTQIEKDITDKKVSELKLQKNEKFLLSITSNMSEGIYRSSADKGIIYCNDAFVKLFGYNSVEEILLLKSENLYFDPDDRTKLINKLKTQKKIINEEVKFKRKNGEVFWGLINTNFYEEDSINSYQDGFVYDISQIKETSSQLKSYNSQLENVMNAINNSAYVIMLDLDFRVKFINNKFCELLKFTNSEVAGNNIIEYIYDGEENIYWNNLKQVILLGNAYRIDINFSDKSNQILWLDSVINPIKDENEECYGYYLIANDITDRKNAEDSIIELNESLELKVLERTSMLNDALDEVRMLNSSLYETNQSLMTLNDEKNDFISIAAHDLKNPLQGIMFAAELVKAHLSKLSTEQILYNMGFIENTSKRMSEIIHNYLNVTSIESGLFNLNFQFIDIKYTIDELINSYIPIAENKSVKIYYETQQISSIIDKNAFIQIIENLLSNAIKFSPSEKAININLEVNEINFMINIIDEGPGLTDIDKQNLFKKFAKLSAKPTAGESSTGLGLSIVKKLVELMNGKINCSSEYGKGAIFTVTLPIRQA